jgi:restriction endonuclease S subunit
MRKELQAEIDRLLEQIEAEKQNMGAAGKKREEELLAKIEALRKDIGYRDTSIA